MHHDNMTKPVKDFRGKIRSEAREKFDQLEPNFQLMYTTERCQMGGEHLTVRQLNRVILQGAPPLCLKHYKQMQGDIEKMAPLFDQLRLF